eukprot:scaffold44414_cov19-Tisochrysis_lutea.AAC.1
MEDPKPDKDMRPRYKKIERVLQQAEDMAAKFVTVAAPRDLEHSTSLPVSRLLARVRLALAGLRLMQVGPASSWQVRILLAAVNLHLNWVHRLLAGELAQVWHTYPVIAGRLPWLA